MAATEATGVVQVEVKTLIDHPNATVVVSEVNPISYFSLRAV